MRKKGLVVFFSMLIFIGFAGMASAAYNDSDTDAVVAGYDVTMVDLTFSQVPGVTPAEYIGEVLVRMVTGNMVPGIVLLEMDLDNDPLTGGSSGLGGISVFPSCGGGTVMKIQPGIDMNVLLILRDQGDDSGTSFCDTCLDVPGGITCEYGRLRGDIYAATGMTTARQVDWQRMDMDYPPATDTVDGTVTYAFRATRMMRKLFDFNVANPVAGKLNFDLNAAVNLHTRYQISSWYSPAFGVTEDDLLQVPPLPMCANITDIIPDSGAGMATPTISVDDFVFPGSGGGSCNITTTCSADIDINGNVGLSDLGLMKAQFGTFGCTYDCACQ